MDRILFIMNTIQITGNNEELINRVTIVYYLKLYNFKRMLLSRHPLAIFALHSHCHNTHVARSCSLWLCTVTHASCRTKFLFELSRRVYVDRCTFEMMVCYCIVVFLALERNKEALKNLVK